MTGQASHAHDVSGGRDVNAETVGSGESAETVGSGESGQTAPCSHHDLVARVAAVLGSAQEARWLVDHVEATLPPAVLAGGRSPAGAAPAGAAPAGASLFGAAPGDARARRDLLAALVARRQAGEPLQYVLGHWSFRSIELAVDRRVLIPRPETEQVVEQALVALRRSAAGGRGSQAPGTGAGKGRVAVGGSGAISATGAGVDGRGGTIVVDLGTGSGAIALSVAVEAGSELSDLTIWATDLSDEALGVARSNQEALVGSERPSGGGSAGQAVGRADRAADGRAHRAAHSRGGDGRGGDGPLSPGALRALRSLRFARGSWFDALPASLRGGVALVVANPPYVSRTDYVRLDPGVRDWEPELALVAGTGTGGVGGTAEIETIVREAPRWLAPGGTLVVEIDPAQAYGVIDLARRVGFGAVRTERDLAGRNRMLVAVR